MEHTSYRVRPGIAAAFGTYLFAGSLLLLLWACYQGTEKSFLDTTSSRLWTAALSGAAGIAVAIALVIFAWFQSSGIRGTEFWLPVVVSSGTVMLVVATLEAGLRLVAAPDGLGRRVGTVTLLPYDWTRLAALNKELLRENRSQAAYFVEDDSLGWTIAPNASSADGMYRSSTEGVRSSTAGIPYLEQNSALRIALIGNSFAFSEEVSFVDSLGFKLEEALPAATQVLNLGVPGYGVDQALLRFQEEAGQLQPRLAIFSFIQDDLNRNVSVYAFLKPSWRLPLSKPRFVVQNGQLQLLNSPTLDPDEIFSKNTIFDLPLLDRDIEFYDRYWRPSPLHASYIFRYLISAYPAWPRRNIYTDDDAIVVLGQRLLEEFVAWTRTAGIVPLAVYLPSRGDFSGQDRSIKEKVIAATGSKGIVVHNLTACASDAAASENLFLPEKAHYSGAGNAVIAACLQPLIHDALGLNPAGAP